MKVIAYTALRYGRDYYDAAIHSMIDAVDEYWVLYATKPSHGHFDPTPCPETEAELRAIAERRAGRKLRWIRGAWQFEGQQRDMIHQLVPDADVVLVLDADEVWNQTLLMDAVGLHPVRHVRLPMIHFWRSMHKAIVHDPAFPVRVIYPKAETGELRLETSDALSPICHFGYAQRPEIVRYKWLIHGHKAELRRDVDWFNDVFLANRQTDCHPVGSEWWNPEPVNPLDYLPAWMAEHPYFGREVIE